ncbi:MAG TPA: aspartate--ammonia ligase, partial [Clostridiales bacterium]|nr:aspartate--ammonia ligase [Clostridiales bacterium]
LNQRYPQLKTTLSRDVYFVTTQELEDRYPDRSAHERENIITREHKTVFLMQIGRLLKSGKRHDGRAPDYDDWSLNGDLFFWNETLGVAEEISSMGIRVDADALKKQLKEAQAEDRMAFPFHQAIANGELPLSIGGGIGQSRVCLLLLEKAHIGEVQVSLWPEEMRKLCQEHNITLLQ